MKTIAKLILLPKENSKVISFETYSTRSNKKMYPKFFITKFTKLPKELKENKLYLLDISVTYAVNEEGKDEKRTNLFLNSVKAEGFNIDKDETLLGLSVINKLIVNDVKKFTVTQKNKNMPGITADFSFYRIKCLIGKVHTYLGYYENECDLVKGDVINATVRLFNKRAYTETGEIDLSEKHIYTDKDGNVQSNGYTELEIVNYQVVD